MKTLRKMDLDSMEREFQVLDNIENQSILGGTIWDVIGAALKDLLGLTDNAVAKALGYAETASSIYDNHASAPSNASMTTPSGTVNTTAVLQEDASTILHSLVPNLVNYGISVAAEKVSEFNANLNNWWQKAQSNPAMWY